MRKLAIVGLNALLASSALAQTGEIPARSRLCKVNEPFARAGGVVVSPTTITMNNDGKPCWYIRHNIVNGGRMTGAPMHVTKQPQFGTVEISVLDNGTRISYKPNTGFTGADEFSVVNEMYNVDRPYKVTVSR